MSGRSNDPGTTEPEGGTHNTTRRSVVRGVGAAAGAGLVGSLAGCTGGGGGGGADTEIYVVAFHWGFRLITPDGTVKQSMQVSSGDTVKFYGLNIEPVAEGKNLDVPDAVYSAAKNGYKDWEHASLERIAQKTGSSVSSWEKKLEQAEKQYKDHGMALINPGGSQVFNMNLPGSMSAPKVTTQTLDASGSYSFTCTIYCGPGHSFMNLDGAIQVS